MRLDPIFRILFVVYCVEAGLFLLVSPWTPTWERLIAAAETGDASAAALFPREAAANRALFYDRAGAPRSAGELLQRLALDVGGATAAPVERAAAPSEPRMGSSAPLSPALLDALMALALAPSLVSAETDDPALNLLRRAPI